MNTSPALSFTVEFGDETKPRLKSGARLSEFVPPKLRNSLSSSHARLEKSFSARGRESSGSCKNSVRLLFVIGRKDYVLVLYFCCSVLERN